MFSPRQKGILEVILSGICFGFLAYFGKLAYAQGLKPGEFLSLRFLIAALILGILLFLKNPRGLKLSKKTLSHCVVLGILGYALFSSCFFQALSGLSASLTVLLLYTFPLFVTVGASLFLSEPISRFGFLALIVTGTGLVSLVAGDVQVTQRVAILFGIGSAIFYSLYILLSKKWLAHENPFITTFYIQLFAALALSLIHLHDFHRIVFIIKTAWLPVLGASIISTIFAMSLFLSGLRRLTSSETSILSTTEPVIALLVAYVFLNERLLPWQVFGAVLVVTGLVLTAMPKKASFLDSR